MSRFKQKIYRSLQKMIGPIIEESLQKMIGPVVEQHHQRLMHANDRGTQLLLRMQYQQLLRDKAPLPSFDDVQFRAFSQTGEDGILLYVFSLLGTTNKQVVEVCAGDGIECNAANLIINHGWRAHLFDGNELNVAKAASFYAKCKDTPVFPPSCVHSWITTDNINNLIRDSGAEGEIDLLSLDIDGNDYWLWEAMDCISPRVIILEYENAWGPDNAVTQAYVPDFVWVPSPLSLPTAGASLPAFKRLAERKGYRLVGCNRLCYNAIFVRNDVGPDILSEVSLESCFGHALAQYRIEIRKKHLETKGLETAWIKV